MTTTYYHYTSRAGATGIQDSKMIYASQADGPNKDAYFGSGVYLTTCGPSNSPEVILKAIYAQQGQHLLPKIEFVVEVQIPQGEVQKIHETTRPIHLYYGDMNLRRYNYRIYSRR